MVRVIRILVAVSIFFTLLNCASSSIDRLSASDTIAVGQAIQEVEKVEKTVFTPKDEYLLGKEVAASILSAYKVYENEKVTEYVNLIGQSLAIFSDLPETYGGYHFLILDSDDLNTFSAPGGLIFVTRGLLKLSASEDMLAGSLAYSIGHVVLHSGVETIRKVRMNASYSALALAGYKAGKPSSETYVDEKSADTMNEMTTMLAVKALTRTQVLRADQMALRILDKTGYEAKAYLDLLNLVSKTVSLNKPNTKPMFPSWEERITEVEKVVAAMKPVPRTPDQLTNRLERFGEIIRGISE